MLRLGIFLTRSDPGKIKVLRFGETGQLLWGSMNRLLLKGDVNVTLPRITPETVGVPLDLVLLATGNVATLTPTGRAGSDGQQAPLINGAATLNVNVLGLYTLKNDGTNWFAGKGV